MIRQPEPVDRPIGVGARLEVGHEPFGAVPAFQPADALVELIGDRRQAAIRRLGLKLSGSQKMHPEVASVPSRLGQSQPASRLNFQTLRAELLSIKEVKAMVQEPGRPPIGRFGDVPGLRVG